MDGALTLSMGGLRVSIIGFFSCRLFWMHDEKHEEPDSLDSWPGERKALAAGVNGAAKEK